MNRRDFISKSALASMAFPFSKVWASDIEYSQAIEHIQQKQKQQPNETLVKDETFWQNIAKLYQAPSDYINLENGYFSPQSLPVYNREVNNMQMLNQQTSWYMRNQQMEDYQEIKQQLAKFIGCDVGELAICRNTTEALDTVIHGMNWSPGDEVITTQQDYYSMIAAVKQESRRHGIKQVEIALPLHPKNDKEVVKAFEKAITPKTKALILTHLINISGQILPAKAIIEMAHANGVEVIMDSAHALAHIPFSIKELGADYMGSSLHKWLGCPLGLGVLYVRQEKIPAIWPLFGDDEFAEDDIRKLEHYGTRPSHSVKTISRAIAFHETLGTDLKSKRLHYLKSYWTNQVQELKKVILNVPIDRSCAIANFAIEGLSPNEVSRQLMENHKVFTVAINNVQVKGVRVTPHLYNSLHDLDELVSGIREIVEEN